MELTDKDGLTESEFLETYDRTAWDRPALTADVVLFSIDSEGKPTVLLIRRGGHPYMGCWAFPGGFVSDGESAEDAAKRELGEETGLSGIYLEQLTCVSTPNRDPRGWTATVCFTAVTGGTPAPEAGDDASEAAWFNIDYARKGDSYELHLKSGELTLRAELDVKRDLMGRIDLNKTEIVSSEGLGFDHAKILLLALERL